MTHGPSQGTGNEPVNEPVGDDADPSVETAEQLETRKKKKLDKSEKKEKKVEENVSETPRKQPSNHLSLDYVVVSDTLSGLDAGEKCTERDPNDDVTLTKIMKKKIFLEDKKKELDEQSAVALAAKKSKLQMETPPAPSESEIDMGVFSAKRGNLLEKIFAASGSKVGEGGGNARGVGDAGAGGDDVQEESSEATPQHTVYTKFVRDSGQGGASGTHRSPEYEHVQGRSSSLCLPPAERLFQKRRNRLDLLDDHIHARVNFFATSQEIAQEWQLIEKFNAEKKGLAWRVADSEEKLAKEKQLNVDKQKDWEIACERTNKELQSQRDAIVRMSGEKRKINDEAHQKREQEYIQRIAKFEKFAEEKIAESKASEIMVEEVITDCKWLLAHAVPLIAERIARSEELAKYMYELGETAYAHGRKEGYAERRAVVEAKEPLKSFDLYKTDCVARYAEKRQEFESLKFAIVKAAGKLSRKPYEIALLRRALGDEDHEGFRPACRVWA
ncbi:hypothetical protein Hanom_Chr04g00288271 [Helianthus anomalus]